jgi:uncharacterized protein
VSAARLELSPEQIRVLGCLLEKQRTTPDAYPLSLNALRLACNQSTNREPVVNYDEEQVRDAVHRLERRSLVRFASGAGSRASKFRHLLAERLPMDRGEEAVMCVLMLRGPQTPGELKQRCDRMHRFSELLDVHETLAALIERELVERLERRPGHKEERYVQLLSGREENAPRTAPTHVPAQPPAPAPITEADLPLAYESAADGPPPLHPPQPAEVDLRERVERLEREVYELRSALLELMPELQR